MDSHWVDMCERQPSTEKVYHVVQVDTGNDTNRTRAGWKNGDWQLCAASAEPRWRVFAWLESERELTDEEALAVPLYPFALHATVRYCRSGIHFAELASAAAQGTFHDFGG